MPFCPKSNLVGVLVDGLGAPYLGASFEFLTGVELADFEHRYDSSSQSLIWWAKFAKRFFLASFWGDSKSSDIFSSCDFNVDVLTKSISKTKLISQ